MFIRIHPWPFLRQTLARVYYIKERINACRRIRHQQCLGVLGKVERKIRLSLRLVEEEKEERERLEKRLAEAQQQCQLQKQELEGELRVMRERLEAASETIESLKGKEGRLLEELNQQQKEVVELKMLIKGLMGRQGQEEKGEE